MYASGVLGLHHVEYALMMSVWTNRGAAEVLSGCEPLRERESMCLAGQGKRKGKGAMDRARLAPPGFCRRGVPAAVVLVADERLLVPQIQKYPPAVG